MHMTPTDYEYDAPERPMAEEFAPDPRASQRVAAAKRARPEQPDEAPAAPTRDPRQLLLGIGALIFVVLMVAAGIWQMATRPPAPLAVTPAPTAAAERVFSAPAQASPAPPQATEAPIPTLTPAAPVLVAPDAPPMTGQGMTLAAPAPVVEVSPADQYIQNVGAQAPHSPRGDGQAGPNGGDWVAVPTAPPAMLDVIGAQAPHKVR